MAEKKTIELEVKSNLGESISDLKALKRQLKDTAAGSEEFKKIFNQIDDLEDKIKSAKNTSSDWIDSLESAGGPIGALGASLNRAKVATQSFGGALKATGIGLVVALIGGLVAAFQDNEVAMKKLQPLLDGIGKLFQGVFRAVEPLFNTLVDLAVSALPTVSKAFGVVYSSVTAVFQSLGMLGGAIKKLISGDFSGAWKDAKSSVNDFSKNYDASIKRFNDGTKELTKVEKEEAEKRAENRKKAEEKRLAEEQKAKEKALADRKAELDKINALEEGFTLKAVDTDKIKSDNANLAMQKDLTNKVAIGQGQLSFSKYMADEEIKIAQAEAQQKKDIQDASFNLASGAVNFLKEIGGKNKAIQKAAIIAENAIGIGKMIIANNAANIGALATPQAILTSGASAVPVIAMNNITTALGVATTIASTAKALQAVGGGSAGGSPSVGGSGGGMGSAPAAPAFNVVGASPTNQLAQTIGNQQQQPIKAYVVANDVTTQQSLDRNIVSSASIG
jgi:hypothetical protein